ncbi:hypothetical protein QYF61_023899 [Mycteria americana]|uniref:Uncharacterized protein n=1 Tax=Mycteria americana TaxID=33587 RepID=A0AAN7NJJ0_MYCAM|nr:hypothetical protein QYF61_023899 [Mycteria americana]
MTSYGYLRDLQSSAQIHDRYGFYKPVLKGHCFATKQYEVFKYQWQRVHKKLGGGTARTADPNWPKGYSIPYDVMLSIENGGSWPGAGSLLGDGLGFGWRVLGPLLDDTKARGFVTTPALIWLEDLIQIQENSRMDLGTSTNDQEPPAVYGWRLHHFRGQRGPMLDNPFSEEIFPNIQSKPPLAQLEAISSCPITCYLGEETDPHLSTTSFQAVVESKKVSPQPPLLPAKQPQFPQPLLIRLVLYTRHQLRCPSLAMLQHLNIL